MDALEVLARAVRLSAACAPEKRLTYAFQAIETALNRPEYQYEDEERVERTMETGTQKTLTLRWTEYSDARTKAWRLVFVLETYRPKRGFGRYIVPASDSAPDLQAKGIRVIGKLVDRILSNPL